MRQLFIKTSRYSFTSQIACTIKLGKHTPAGYYDVDIYKSGVKTWSLEPQFVLDPEEMPAFDFIHAVIDWEAKQRKGVLHVHSILAAFGFKVSLEWTEREYLKRI